MRQIAHPTVHVPSLDVERHRGLALLALIVVLAVAATATFLVVDDGDSGSSVAPQPRISEVTGGRGIVAPPVQRYDGGPNEGTAGVSTSSPAPAVRYDGGPNEGSAEITPSSPAPPVRYDGGPSEGFAGR